MFLRKKRIYMIVTFQKVVPLEDYKLQITMSNGNQLKFDMKPYLNTIQFCPLRDIDLWKNVQVYDTYLLWNGKEKVELSIDTLLAYFKLRRG
jgi:hypothetical protein